MPASKYSPCPRWLLFSVTLFVAHASLYPAQQTINFSTWLDFTNFNATDPDASTKLLKALNAAGTTPTSLFGDATPDTTYNGDLIELGFLKTLVLMEQSGEVMIPLQLPPSRECGLL